MKNLLLAMLTISTLAGCSYSNAYVLYDSRGCAFSVTRTSSNNENSDTWSSSGGSEYQASIMRISAEDKSTCPLRK